MFEIVILPKNKCLHADKLTHMVFIHPHVVAFFAQLFFDLSHHMLGRVFQIVAEHDVSAGLHTVGRRPLR